MKEENMYHVCENLKRLREERGLSIRALSREVGITHYTLGAYERAQIVPSLENGFKLAEFFDVPVEYLVKGKKVNTELGTKRKKVTHLTDTEGQFTGEELGAMSN